MDARERLEKMRNLKEGNLEVKKIGGITKIKKVGGKIELSTKTKAGKLPTTGPFPCLAGLPGPPCGPWSNGSSPGAGGPPLPPSPNRTTQIGRLTKTVTSSGKVRLLQAQGRSPLVTNVI